MEKTVKANTQKLYSATLKAFQNYTEALKSLVEVMEEHGIETRNVDPYANFAEVLVAHKLEGKVQKATNAGYDVLASNGQKVQVKSLRVSTGKLLDNGRGWAECTRVKGNPKGNLIDTDLLAIVIYLDHAPYCMLLFPISERDYFPVIEVKVLNFTHVEKLMTGKYEYSSFDMRVIDLRDLGIERVEPSVT